MNVSLLIFKNVDNKLNISMAVDKDNIINYQINKYWYNSMSSMY